jgi:hypothetical protein
MPEQRFHDKIVQNAFAGSLRALEYPTSECLASCLKYVSKPIQEMLFHFVRDTDRTENFINNWRDIRPFTLFCFNKIRRLTVRVNGFVLEIDDAFPGGIELYVPFLDDPVLGDSHAVTDEEVFEFLSGTGGMDAEDFACRYIRQSSIIDISRGP